MISRKEALEKVAQYAALLQKYIDQRCILSWSKHSYTGVIPLGIELAKVTDLANKPEKREIDGKMKTPFVFSIITNQGKLHFLLEDTEVMILANGLRFRMGYDIELRME